MSIGLHQRPAIEAGDPSRFAVRIEFVPNLDLGFAGAEEDLIPDRTAFRAGARTVSSGA